jgi:GH15 family glucan-1,4-alpha-glucosidase
LNDLELAAIGNCQVSALLDKRARIVWCCLPRFDANPAFCTLLEPRSDPNLGLYEIELLDFSHAEQEYIRNTPIVQTTLYDTKGNALRITDFAPRFELYGRIYHPVMMIRSVTPVQGWPRIRVRVRPAGNYGAEEATITHGSNHIRYVLPGLTLRLTTDVPLTAIMEEHPFILTRAHHLLLGSDESIPEATAEIARDHFGQTQIYWESWVRGLAIPFDWQEAVIRAAITLKLCTFEDTGAVIAAMTTSLPEAADSGRNWDYRFCWLRDSYFVVKALNSLGATRTMEAYLEYILNVSFEDGGYLQPVYSITGQADLTETTVDTLAGYRGMGPVRVGNQAYEQVQNDVYGAVVLSATQYFFDRRLVRPGNEASLQRLELLGKKALELYNEPDAGIWEYRGRKRVHTFSSLMCWAACDRLARISAQLQLGERSTFWSEKAEDIRAVIYKNAWDDKRKTFTDTPGRAELDASLLLMPSLGFISGDDPRFLGTLKAIESELRNGDHMMRYHAADDFGHPENAFNICTFWFIDALASVGREEEARELFENMLGHRNAMGLLSEDLDPTSGELWGNFPQTYSMVGIINAARRLSRNWEDEL